MRAGLEKDTSTKGTSVSDSPEESHPEEVISSEACEELTAVIQDLPPEKQDQIKHRVGIIVQQASSSFQGPIPHPDHFAQYDKVLPGAAERILKMAESEQANRHKHEDVVDRLFLRGLSLGSLIIVLLIGLAVLALYLGYPEPAIIIVTSIIALAVIYVLRKRPKGTQGE